jgi:hypothetical protein
MNITEQLIITSAILLFVAFISYLICKKWFWNYEGGLKEIDRLKQINNPVWPAPGPPPPPPVPKTINEHRVNINLTPIPGHDYDQIRKLWKNKYFTYKTKILWLEDVSSKIEKEIKPIERKITFNKE